MDFPPNPSEKPGFQLEFQDEFLAAKLNTDNWFSFYLPQWSSRERTAARYSLSNGRLQLHLEAEDKPWCPEYDGDIRVSALQTGCFSGPVGSSIGQLHFRQDLIVFEAQPTVKLYTPLYGYFEIRLKAIPIPGYMVALWMAGFEERPNQSGEICICEIFGREMTADSAQIGYGIHPFNDPELRDEFYQDRIGINAADFHIYAAEWTPTHVNFFVDNAKTRTIAQSPNYPMQFMLAAYEIPEHLTPESKQTPWPKTFEVDYVRGYSRR
ncbi:MAG: glycoside hydrolase family 16 protein [Candidatus Promineifilaceae bacterium]